MSRQPLWFQWALWGLWQAWRLLSRTGRLAWTLCTSTLLRRLLSATALALLLGSALLLGPLAWRRAAFLYEAADLASRSEGMGEGELQEELRRRAFRLGLSDVATQPEAIGIAFGSDELGATCTVELRMHQRVGLGPLEARLPLHGRVRRRVVGARPKAAPPPDSLD